jgi:hypothetical protein
MGTGARRKRLSGMTHVQTTVICPETQAELAINLPADDRDLPAYWAKPVSVECPICNKRHVNSYGDLIGAAPWRRSSASTGPSCFIDERA